MNDEQLKQLLASLLPEQSSQIYQEQEPPQLQQGLLGDTGENLQALQALAQSGANSARNMAQVGQAAANQSAGNQNALMAQAGMQAAAQQQAAQQQKEQQQRQMLMQLAKMWLMGGA